MNRRKFIGSLVGVPLAAMYFAPTVAEALSAQSVSPRPTPMVSEYDFYPILNAYEMSQYGFTPVTTPCFLVDRNPYCIKTWKLKLYSDGVPDMSNWPFSWNSQELAVEEIRKLGLTHLYVVGFLKQYVIMPNGSHRHCAFVRGATVKS